MVSLQSLQEKRKASKGCPGCGAVDCTTVSLPSGSGYSSCQCSRCHLRFSDPMTAAGAEWYLQSHIYQSRATWLGSAFSRTAHAVPRWEFQQALSVFDLGSRKLLDVGCGEGEFLSLAQQAGFSVTGVDFNPVSVELARKVTGISSVYECSAEKLSEQFSESQFDVVIMFEVLEHLADPLGSVRILKSLLRPGGFLCLSVPGVTRWPRLFDPEVDLPPHHLTLWTEDALGRILERAGLSVREVARKPLNPADLGVHLKWRLQRLVRGLRNSQVPPANCLSRVPASSEPAGLAARRAIRQAGLAMVTAPCWLLRLHPKAGGFTLFARAEKP